MRRINLRGSPWADQRLAAWEFAQPRGLPSPFRITNLSGTPACRKGNNTLFLLP